MTTNNTTDPNLDPKAELEQLLGELPLHPYSHRRRTGVHWRVLAGPSANAETPADGVDAPPGFVAVEPRTRRAAECPLPTFYLTSDETGENLIIQGTPVDSRGFSFFPQRTSGVYRIEMADASVVEVVDSAAASDRPLGEVIPFPGDTAVAEPIGAAPTRLYGQSLDSTSKRSTDESLPHRVLLHNGLELELQPVEESRGALIVVNRFHGRRPDLKEGRVWRIRLGTETVELKYGYPKRLEKYDHRTAVSLLPSVRPE